MKEEVSLRIGIVVFLLIVLPFAFAPNNFWDDFWGKVTGNVVSNSQGGEMQGPDAESVACMENCYLVEGKSEDVCMSECGMQPKPKPADKREECMQKCVAQDCDERDFQCETGNKARCEEECNMKGDAPDESEMNEEQRCISECVSKVDPMIRCGNSKEGETGNDVCQRCANECVHLYSGPCLNDEQINEKEEACKTCEHCYGEPIEGASGQGWDCIVDIECKDASSEFGDEAGEGQGIVKGVGEAVGNVFEGIGNFFKGIFGGGKDD